MNVCILKEGGCILEDGPLGSRNRHWLQVDLGAETVVRYFDMGSSNQGFGQDPRMFQIWGFNDQADANTWASLFHSNNSNIRELTPCPTPDNQLVLGSASTEPDL